MSSKGKNNAYSASNVDAAMLQELANVAEIGVYGDLTPLVLFVQNNNLVKALTNITYFSSVNDIGQVARNARHLGTVLGFINFVIHDTNSESPNLAVKLSLIEERERIVEFYSELCTKHLKTIYKFYGMRKPLAVIALTSLLLALVEYKNHLVLTTFQDNFDFNHSAFPKILVPTRDEFEKKIIGEFSMRLAVVELWIAICTHSNSSFRKSLLTNFKVMNNFWKYVEMERYETISKIIEFLNKSVLSEPSFKRSTKCQILNENFLYNFRNLFALVKSDNDRKDDNDINDFDSFKSDFLKFMDVLVSDQAKGITYPQNEFGSPLVVNNRTFKINNKLIYTLLTALKPWDSHAQLQFCLKILNSNQELVAPFTNWIVTSSGGYHDPSLTSYWIGHTLLYTEILKSSAIPVETDTISLAPLSRSAMTECLAYPSNLVKQLGLQLLLLQLKKLTSTKSPLQLVVDSVLSNFPAQASFIPLLKDENKLIKVTATIIMRKIESLLPTSSSSAVVAVVSQNLSGLKLGESDFDSYKLVLLDNYLSIQSSNDLKWWNKSSNGQSFFTSLLKLSNIAPLKSKVFQILEKLTRTSFIFGREDLIESTLLVLIDSIGKHMGCGSFDKLWNCFDETIARCMKLPYKYLDKSHIEYGDVSVFLVALFEQLNFVADIREDLNLMEWLNDFSTQLVVIGESKSTILKLAKGSQFNLTIDLGTVLVKEHIVSKYDLAEAIIALNRSISSAKENAIFELVTKIGSYLTASDLSDKSLFAFITNPQHLSFFELVNSSSMNANEALVLTVFSELFQQLSQDMSDTKLNEFIFKASLAPMPKKNQSILAKYLWILSDQQLIELASNFENDILVVAVFKLIHERTIDFEPDFTQLLALQASDLEPILKSYRDSIKDYSLICSNKSLFFLLDEPSAELAQYLLSLEAIPDDVLYRVAFAASDIAEKFKDLVIQLALSMGNWVQSLKIFTKYSTWFERDSVFKLVFTSVEDQPRLSMTSTFADFVSLYVGTFKIQKDDQIKLWLQRAMIYVNKKFAESPELSLNFDRFLDSIVLFITTYKQFQSSIQLSVMNTQFEVLLGHKKWVSQEKYLAYANQVLLKWTARGLNSDKLLQILITNENIALRELPKPENSASRFQTALLVYVLFNYQGSKSATIALMDQILELYLGLASASDLLLKRVLVDIETKVTKSWVSKVTNWDFMDELSQKDIDLVGEERLFIKDNSNFVVTLNKRLVSNAVKNMRPNLEIPQGKNYEAFLEFFSQSFQGRYYDFAYDPEFLLLVVLNNDELVSEEEGKMKFNLTKLINSGILQFVVNCLALPHVREISKVILNGILKFLNSSEDTLKDKSIIKIYVSTILHTLRVSDHSTNLIWHFIGEIANIITNPGHFLYERVTRYVLSTPVIQPFEIPLYKPITLSLANEDAIDEDNFYKEVTWLIELLTNGIQSADDLRVLRYREVIEWALNVSNLPYCSATLKSRILNFINRIQTLLVDGTDTLVTKFAGFSSLEILKRSLDTTKFSGCQQALNIDQISLKTAIVSQSQKRIREWTDHTVSQATKRIHSQ